MKQAFAVLWQTIVLVIAAWSGFVAGMIVPSIRIQRVISQTAVSLKTYDYNWIVAVVIVYALLLLIGVLRKRLRATLITATAALILTLVLLALFTHIGVKEVNVFG
jgi:hypothetical protein